ncbi:hypothetical protein ARMSODRAFT_979138 [Armillaria solidipes]|uniref:Uncharacterized protein n=1 Tax=Armillaria solidipes TaxID=1076256 RepID=A0A2H3B077_9AGAR|nr:hypothetical protein ARMSODRAFT_979138 [Armillaria solidipes]
MRCIRSLLMTAHARLGEVDDAATTSSSPTHLRFNVDLYWKPVASDILGRRFILSQQIGLIQWETARYHIARHASLRTHSVRMQDIDEDKPYCAGYFNGSVGTGVDISVREEVQMWFSLHIRHLLRHILGMSHGLWRSVPKICCILHFGVPSRWYTRPSLGLA